MSKQNEMPPTNFGSPPYEQDKSQQPPAYYGPSAPQPVYPNQGMPPPAGYPVGPPPPAGYHGMPPQPYAYQYGNVVVQQPLYVAPASGPPPPDHMTAAILATLFCFWPTGIIAIMRASDSRAAAARGDIAHANSLAQSAKSMINISVIIGIISIIIIAVIMGVYFGFVVKKLYDMDDDHY